MKRALAALLLAAVLAGSLSSCRSAAYMTGQAAGWVTTAPIRLLKGG
jgi:hypothetical protein